MDLLSGEYDPGYLYVFRGRGKGLFAARETITDQAGVPVRRRSVQSKPVESFGSWLTMVDWDADSDLDLVLGSFHGEIFLRRNEGTATTPKWATTNVAVQLGDRPLLVTGAHASPVAVDWDRDGLFDLLSGSENGGVYWYRNTGRKGSPAFTAEVALVQPHDGSGYGELLVADAEAVPGIRSQIAVADYDGDGKLDLLLGDFSTLVSPKPDATAAQIAELREAMAQVNKGQRRINEVGAAAEKEWRAWIDTNIPADKRYEDASQDRIRVVIEATEAKLGLPALQAALGAIRARMQPLLGGRSRPPSDSDDDAQATAHGFVWLFRRR